MEEKSIEGMLKKSVESIVRSKIEEELEQEVKEFANKLESRKEEYIAEIVKAVSICQERDERTFGVIYRITIENIVKPEK